MLYFQWIFSLVLWPYPFQTFHFTDNSFQFLRRFRFWNCNSYVYLASYLHTGTILQANNQHNRNAAKDDYRLFPIFHFLLLHEAISFSNHFIVLG